MRRSSLIVGGIVLVVVIGLVTWFLTRGGQPTAGSSTPTVSITVSPTGVATRTGAAASPNPGILGGYTHLVVIVQENHSFDNLWGTWGKVGNDTVNGLKNVPQVAQDGTPLTCLPMNDANLTSPPLSVKCTDNDRGISSHFANAPFNLTDYVALDATTCPQGAPEGAGRSGGCTRDLVHRFYQTQYQINGGTMNRFVTGSDAIGLTMGMYETQKLPLYAYLHAAGAPNYVIADNFFGGAFGGSFLNHQLMIAGRAPIDTSGGASGGARSVLDSNGMVGSYPLYQATGPAQDGQLTPKCANGGNDYAQACGDFAINTMQPGSKPYVAGPRLPLIDDRQYPNIGDRMVAASVTWNWYSGGWDKAVAGNAGTYFEPAHQPFNYFRDYAEGGPHRDRLLDEKQFFTDVAAGTLPQVSFVKPYGDSNEHPGSASELEGNRHAVELLTAIMAGPQAKDTLVLLTYDEFGGSFDHVPVPKGDAFGPGPRIPAVFVSAGMTASGVDHTQYDLTSIPATIERAYGLDPLSGRDAAAKDFSRAVRIGGKG